MVQMKLQSLVLQQMLMVEILTTQEELLLAARYREAASTDSKQEPDEAWDESIVALLNYPEVLETLNMDDLDVQAVALRRIPAYQLGQRPRSSLNSVVQMYLHTSVASSQICLMSAGGT